MPPAKKPAEPTDDTAGADVETVEIPDAPPSTPAAVDEPAEKAKAPARKRKIWLVVTDTAGSTTIVPCSVKIDALELAVTGGGKVHELEFGDTLTLD